MNKKKLIIGISGATCSGKSSLAIRIHESHPHSILIKQDDYFLPIDDPRHINIPELNHYNWEILTSMDMKKMISDVQDIVQNENNTRLLILEGFLLFNCKQLADICDLKYSLTLTREQCWERRKKRTYNPADVPGYFEKVVWPEYMRHQSEIMKDTNLHKSIIFIDGSKDQEEIFTFVSSHLFLEERKQ